MIVGIDLGTTHSLIGVHSAEGPRLFPNPHGDLLTPSVVSLDGKQVLVGQPARDRLVSHPDHTVATFKRWMGTDRETRLGDGLYRPEELSALVLRSLLADAEAALGQPVREAVISVPAYFSDAQRKATRTAGMLAGIRVERLINEPTAAALAYGLQRRGEDGKVMVLDLGGGTFDVSLLELFEGIVEVHASAGDNYLGGEDFLQVLEQAFHSHQGIDRSALPARELAQLGRHLEAMKRELSGGGQARMQIQLDGNEHQWAIDESAFSLLCEPLLQRMRAPVERAMRDAKLKPDDLDEIILVGGAVRMPMISRMVTRMFGRLPLRHVHPDHAIALGTAIAGGLKARDESLEEVVMTDVCPYTLGTQVARANAEGEHVAGFFHPIIPRNSVVPVSREDHFYAASETQDAVCIDVFQGESPMVANNIKLGEVRVPLSPRKSGDAACVKVRFTYDVDGLLHVEAIEQSSGKRHELVLQQGQMQMDDARIAERIAALASLKIHPREEQQNLALVARMERLYEERLDLRSRLQDCLAGFRDSIDSQDRQRVDAHRSRLSLTLDELESQR
ncbi:molecular chaperone HscC [Stenotrophomonas rhizophila]|uniref:molecular chaperone HscC n=1 Tax=Stenotrophomonas rhizophila TaxID=216778 RepID=UPI001E473941|nr:molecular chaperone HscC [Stenotrophomonas rhizophila]MCC7635468.1 molecular chaperone HscC [Stenotrophomonas rhizophila]MCC7664666.1 molecular chaperone HscC [Stenotrophomonas rhizophila]